MPSYRTHPFPLTRESGDVRYGATSQRQRSHAPYFRKSKVALILAWAAAQNGEVEDPTDENHLHCAEHPCYLNFALSLSAFLPEEYRLTPHEVAELRVAA